MPEKGKLSDEMPDDCTIHENCSTFIGEMEVYLHADIPSHLFTAAKHMIEKYHERESLLFANNGDHTIPRTNNGMERFFRKIRRNVRKRCGNIATGSILAQSGEAIALFQNMSNPKYVKTVFGPGNIPALFARYRRPFSRPGMTKKKTAELVDVGIRMMLTDSLPDTPYNENLMETAYSSRKASAITTTGIPHSEPNAQFPP